MSAFIARILEKIGMDALKALIARARAWWAARQLRAQVARENADVKGAKTAEELENAADQNRRL